MESSESMNSVPSNFRRLFLGCIEYSLFCMTSVCTAQISDKVLAKNHQGNSTHFGVSYDFGDIIIRNFKFRELFFHEICLGWLILTKMYQNSRNIAEKFDQD